MILVRRVGLGCEPFLESEKPVAELQGKVEELRAMGESGDAVAIGEEIQRLEAKASQALARHLCAS